MSKLLNIKHWQLLGFMLSPSTVIEFFNVDNLGLWNIVGSTWCVLIYLLWLYSIGMKLYNEHLNSKLQIIVFNGSFYFIAFYSLLMLASYPFTLIDFNWWQLPIHFVGLFSSFYMMYFVAKSLVKIEMLKGLIGSDFVTTFVSIWFFPIGVFFVQSRINRIQSFNDK